MAYPNKRYKYIDERFADRIRRGKYPRLGRLAHPGNYLATDKRDNPPKTRKIIVIVLTLLALALLSMYATAIAQHLTVGKSLAFIAILMLVVVWTLGKLEK